MTCVLEIAPDKGKYLMISEVPLRTMALECSECDEQFSSRQNLNKHMVLHTWENSYTCEECGEKFSKNSALEIHMLNHSKKKSFKCQLCGNIYSANKNLKRHQKTCGRAGSLSKTKCLHPSCEKRFFHVTKMIHHLESQHSGIKVEANEIHFQSLSDFGKWKEEEEYRTHTYFSRASGKTQLKGAVYWYFTCQHDGSARFHCKKGEAGRLTNRKWGKGRVKTGLTCPSRIMARQFSDGKVSVKYISTHSHEINSENKKFQPLPGSLLNKVKEQLVSGVAPREIQKNLQKGYVVGNNGTQKKDKLVTLKQLNQLKRKLRTKSQSGLNDLSSLVSIVSKLKENAYNPVIIFKTHGQNILCGNALLAELPHFEDLVVIGLQTEEQLEVMKNITLRIMSVVTVNWFKDNDICMLSLVVSDELGNGYPVAHFLTNHKDEDTLRCLFSNLLDRCPDMKITAIMTDTNNFGLSALKSLFGNVQHLLCQGCVRQSWQEKIKQLENCDKNRYELSAVLDVLLYEREEDTLKQICYTFIDTYSKLSPVFMEYFCNYFLDRQFHWASCYRTLPEGSFDFVEYSETFVSNLKVNFRERNCDNTMSDYVLMLLALEKNSAIDSGTGANHHASETKRHVKGIQILDSEVSRTGDIWRIADSSSQDIYSITKVAEVCREDLCFQRCMDLSCAGLCSHLYLCDCGDEAGLCKHVHKVNSLDFRQKSVLLQRCIWGNGSVVCLKSEQELYFEHEQEVYCCPEKVDYSSQSQESIYIQEPVDEYREHSIYVAQDQDFSLKQEPELFYEQEIFIQQEEEVVNDQEPNISDSHQLQVDYENPKDIDQKNILHRSTVETIVCSPGVNDIDKQGCEHGLKDGRNSSSEHHATPMATNNTRFKSCLEDARVRKLLLPFMTAAVNQQVMLCESTSSLKFPFSNPSTKEPESSTPSVTVIDYQPSSSSVAVIESKVSHH